MGVSLDRATSLKAWFGEASRRLKDRKVGPARLEVVCRILGSMLKINIFGGFDKFSAKNWNFFAKLILCCNF
jgi:hypothetical protein